MKIPRLQYVIAALLFLATMINYLDRVALGVVSVEIRKDFSSATPTTATSSHCFWLRTRLCTRARGC
jgi:hypothetical protein